MKRVALVKTWARRNIKRQMSENVKSDAEAQPLGSFKISFQVGGLPLAEDVERRIGEAFQSLIREQVDRGLREIVILRAIVFAENFGAEVAKWQTALGLPVGHTNDAIGSAGGKTLTWGDGRPETTYAVIIALAGIGGAFVCGDALAKGMLVHELAHIVDDYHLIRENLKEAAPAAHDLPRVVRFVASNIRAEAFAEIAAGPYWPPDRLATSVNLTLDMAKVAYEQSGLAIAKWREDRDTWKLWVGILGPVSTFCAQLGRVIGLLSASKESADSESKRLLESLEEIDPFLVRIYGEMKVACLNLLATEHLSLGAFESSRDHKAASRNIHKPRLQRIHKRLVMIRHHEQI
jgi:hypothetical protein